MKITTQDLKDHLDGKLTLLVKLWEAGYLVKGEVEEVLRYAQEREAKIGEMLRRLGEAITWKREILLKEVVDVTHE